ncbi:SET domain-containing protein [Rickenella mellea]|uniref:SET domain-containing protein n=1 Tax=Rickenella mellea TaxID=50990 RepID=A0A4Y7Q4V4_9AGAM|nr:SET domain-containing protein [Rickenella mellea]
MSTTDTDLNDQYDNVALRAHPKARSQAVARHRIHLLTDIIKVEALATILLPDEKGKRCDACFHHPPRRNNSPPLKRCSGCAAYWYCNTRCQVNHWNLCHKGMCKQFPRYHASEAYTNLPPHQKLDALLLSHLVAGHPSQEHANNSLSTFLSLLPHNPSTAVHPPICAFSGKRTPTAEFVNHLFERFENNNFVIHSHLVSTGHGIFPLASRLFNHSCAPNAVVAFISENCNVSMIVRPLRVINEGEEITIPYIDPALPFHRRRQILELSYGFSCRCSSCMLSQSIRIINSPVDFKGLETPLIDFVFSKSPEKLPEAQCLSSLPKSLHHMLHELCLPHLSATFSDHSHDGPYTTALHVGRSLLALYCVVYPPNYPQIGMHCLEMAKTAWNKYTTEEFSSDSSQRFITLENARMYLRMGEAVLSIMGPEGDIEGGPLEEISTLKPLLVGSE